MEEIGKSGVVTITVGCYKPDLNRTSVLLNGHRLYYYLTRFLVERISWYCRDSLHLIHDGSNGTVKLYFSNRASMGYSDMQDYLDLIRLDSRVQIHWPVLTPLQIQPLPHARRDGLQVADAVVSSWFNAFEPTPQNVTEPRYAREVLPRAYRRFGRLRSYGLKLFPGETETRILADPVFAWLQ